MISGWNSHDIGQGEQECLSLPGCDTACLLDNTPSQQYKCGISMGDLEKLLLTSGYAYTGEQDVGRMVQKALQHTVTAWQQHLGRPPRLGVVLDGAHAIPCLTPTSTDA